MAVGRPTSYRKEYCEALIEHMKKGLPFEAFGAVVHCAKTTLYSWLEVHPEFQNARKEGEGYLVQHYVNMGQMLATGQLRRVKSESVRTVVDHSGREVPVTDSKGNIVYDRTYEPVVGNATAWIFLCKNILNWRDRKDIEMSGKDGGPIDIKSMSDDDLLSRLEALKKGLKK